jgi:hypothetical protein
MTLVSKQTIPTKRPPLIGEVSAVLRIGGVVWSAQWTPMAMNLGILNQSHYFSIQVGSQLYSWGWVDLVRDPVLLRKSSSTGNRACDLWICS